MANESNKNTYTAADIERYHKGLLSAKERHAIEKAALDDPFLADMLEGYSLKGIDIAGDIAELTNRLSKRTGDSAKVIPVLAGNRRATYIRWLRVAAIIVAVAGACLLVYQIGFNKNSADAGIATASPINKQTKEDETNLLVKPDTSASSELLSSDDSNNNASDTIAIRSSEAQINTQSTDDGIAKYRRPTNNRTNDTVYVLKAKDAVASSAPKVYFQDASVPSQPTDEQVRIQELADKNNYKSKKEGSLREVQAASSHEKKAAQPPAKNSAFEQSYLTNTFRGRVIDEHNNGLPFASVTNIQDGVGTYTDASGNFNLTSTDSILNVQVKALGFNSNNIQLRGNAANNVAANNVAANNNHGRQTAAPTQVVMEEDKSIAAHTLSNRKLNYVRRSRDANFKLEGEPEPEDGWESYDSYLSNNLNIPEEALRSKQAGEGTVDVSFEVNKYGEPVNFKVEKSLCEKCDKEAIRLIKEGPKWKRKARKGRTTVTIAF